MSDYLLPYAIMYDNCDYSKDMYDPSRRIRFDGRDGEPFLVQTSSLFDYQWAMAAYDRAQRDGGRAVFARRGVLDKTLVLDVFADTQEAHNAAVNRLHDVLEYNTVNLTPGRLYINNQYIECFAHTSVKTLDRDWTTYTVIGLTLKAVSPAWTYEEEITIPAGSEDTAEISNYGIGGAPMIITVYGPCTAPVVTVGGNAYGITGTLGEGQYVTINQPRKTIIMTEQRDSGDVTENFFNRRKKDTDNFLPAVRGTSAVKRSAAFECRIIYQVQRSEPRLTVSE